MVLFGLVQSLVTGVALALAFVSVTVGVTITQIIDGYENNEVTLVWSIPALAHDTSTCTFEEAFTFVVTPPCDTARKAVLCDDWVAI
jgi:hypothetical protein